MPENYSQPGWFERNLPLIAGGGTLLSRQQQYLTERQPQPVDPRNAWARAFGDSLEAFYRGQTAQQQMGANRQQLFQSSQLFPLELKKAHAEYQALQHAQQMRQQFPAQIDAMFGANSKAAMVLKSMPYAQALQMMTSMLSGQLKPKARPLTEEELRRGNWPPGTVEMPDGSKAPPDKSVLDWRRMQEVGGTGGFWTDQQEQERLGIDPYQSERVVVQDDPENPGVPKITQVPKVGQEERRSKSMRDAQDNPALLATRQYLEDYTKLYKTGENQLITDPFTGESVWKLKPPIENVGLHREPTHPDYVKVLEEHANLRMQKGDQGAQATPTTGTRRTNIKKALTAINHARDAALRLKPVIKNAETTDILGVKMLPKTGQFAVEVKAYVKIMQDALLQIGEYGAPQEAELKRLEDAVMPYSDLSAGLLFKSWGDEKNYALNQIKTYLDTLDFMQVNLKEEETGLSPTRIQSEITPPSTNTGNTTESGGSDRTRAEWEAALE